ncbi:hypothetical protein O0L34_g569 [Tuta absoluta]|nr:hypothetical protein O0L34_g569 [Tuta absoluta]
MVSMDLIEMDAVVALLELGVNRVFNHNNPPSPDEPEVEMSAAVPEIMATSTPKSPEFKNNTGPSNPEVVKVSCGLIVQNRTSDSPPTPKHIKIETSKRKLNLYPKMAMKKKLKVDKSVDESLDLDTQSEDEDQPQIEKMQARVKTLTTEMRHLEAKLKKYQQFDSKKEEHDVNPSVKRHNTVAVGSLSGNDSPIMRRCNTSSANWNKPQTNGSGYCRWESFRKYDVDSKGMVRIGDGHATVPARLLKQLEGTYYTNAVRKLLTAVFSRRILATHSLTGKPSPAFPNKPAKKKLDSALVNDIIQTVCDNCNVEENLVRISITTKCADESKMLRSRENNKNQRRLSKKENSPLQNSSSEESSSE